MLLIIMILIIPGADAVATGHYARNSLGNFLENQSSKQGEFYFLSLLGFVPLYPCM